MLRADPILVGESRRVPPFSGVMRSCICPMGRMEYAHWQICEAIDLGLAATLGFSYA